MSGVHIIDSGTEVAIIDGIRFWADRGLIHWEDSKDDTYGSQSVKTFLERLEGMNEMLGNSTEDELFKYADLRKKIQDYISDGLAIAKKAQVQGMPSDSQSASEFHRRKKKRFVVPNVVDMSCFDA